MTDLPSRFTCSCVARGLTAATLVLGAFLAFGCGRQETSVPVAVKPPVEQARAILEQFAETGETDSSIVALRDLLDGMAAADASKGGLVADCDTLMSLQGKEQVRTKVREMIEALR
jgi:hypothetical protein